MGESALWNEFGIVYRKMGAYDDAIRSFERAIELAPHFGLAYSNLAMVYSHKGNQVRAISLHQKSIELLKNDNEKAIVWRRVGDIYHLAGDYSHAMAAYRRADELYSRLDEPARVDLPELNLLKGFGKELEGDISPEVASEKDEEFPPDDEMVTDVPAGALSLDDVPPSPVPAPGEMGNWLKELVEDRMLGNKTKLPGSRPPFIGGQPGTGITPPVLSAGAEAASGLLTMVELEPPQTQTDSEWVEPQVEPQPAPEIDEDVVSQRLPAMGRVSPALEANIRRYEHVTQTSPNNGRAWNELGKLYKDVGRNEDAIVAFKQAISLEPGQEMYLYHLGQVYAARKQHNLAVDIFQTVIALNPDHLLAHCSLAGSYRHLGMQVEAEHHIEIAMPHLQTEKEYNRACFEAICGNVDQALTLLRVALDKNQTTLEWICNDPDLDSLRGDPRFVALLGQG